MNCLCCKKETGLEGKLFAEVFCCPDCYQLAVRFMERAEADLRSLRIMMKELVRQGLLEGRLQFQPTPAGEVPKSALLTVMEGMAQSHQWPSQRSTEDTPPNAVDAGG